MASCRTRRGLFFVWVTMNTQNMKKMSTLGQAGKGLEANLLTINCRSLRHTAKRIALWQNLRDLQVDIAVLTETYLTDDKAGAISRECTDYKFWHTFGTTRSRGVTIAIKKALGFTFENNYTDKEGRLLAVNIKADDEAFVIIGCYAPNIKLSKDDWEDSAKFYREMEEWMIEWIVEDRHIVWAGDFNVALNRDLDIESGSKESSKGWEKATETIEEICDIWGLLDAGRTLEPDRTLVTFWAKGMGGSSELVHIKIFEGN